MKVRNYWKSSASIKNLKKRAEIITNIRNLFSNLNVLEVETPILSYYSVTDVHFEPFVTTLKNNRNKKMWLVPSPEYHMKRLLALKKINSIYQISRSFRNRELGGPYHNPEFTILEWYKIDCDMHDFMKHVKLLLLKIIDCKNVVYMSYQQAFIKYLTIDPLVIKKKELIILFKDFKIYNLISETDTKSNLLEMLFSLKIETCLNKHDLTFIYHYPVDQAALAAVNKIDSRIADRFEVFFKGLELGNGFYELTNMLEQKKRFQLNNNIRKNLNKPQVKLDKFFLKALSQGLPACSGIAIGLDRLIMSILNLKDIKEVIAFPIDRC